MAHDLENPRTKKYSDFKSLISNRWWVGLENINLIQMERSFIPCVEDDYLLSKNSILSDRILLRIRNKMS